MELPNHAKQLLLQLNQQRAKGFLCDVIIVVENALFRAHKNILAASSMYFKSLVLHDNLINLDTDMVNPTVFRQILDFIYTGKLLTTDQPGEQNFNALLTAASYLQLHDLAALCRKKLKRNGRSFAGRAGGPSVGRPPRSQRLSTTSVIQTRYSGSTEGMKGSHSKELPKGKVSDDEIFISNSNQENSHSLSRGASKNSDSANGSSGDQELGLDLSKKSPSLPTAASQDDTQHSESQHGSPQSASAPAANSASSFNESAAGAPQSAADSSEPMEMDMNEESRSLAESGQRKSLRHSARKKEWIKKDNVFDRKEGGKGGEEGEGLPNGILVGPLSKSTERNLSNAYGPEQAFQCKEEIENGKEMSDDSGQSECESGGHTSANYVYRQEGFEPVAYGDNLYVCIPCGKGFPSSEQLNAHVETHTEEDLYIKEEGTYGGKEEAEDLSNPNQPYAAESRPFKCSVCEKSYKDPATLRQHEKTHWLTRPFPCNICGKMFTQRGTMTRHMRSHLGLKPFACEECGMRFTRQYRLTEHMRVHSGEKPYECQLCGGKFTQQRNLISHLRMHTSPT
ncbi:hypermethylated in cancer 2 protein [Chelonoidis abingdonii]|uniref:hypermethylated in cancer 2 protein n=1 Tax=Chelonoidis abingdonii TaxID=106734 RepID=UPI0013F1A124|nr:hypermethylated in cancer 2 protein [Chelonoidis abingdonii]XP_032620577.1 hypermethylated in cancer 2 protein [Chelonoidis abingdonii]XP_032620578.1 hypermethylated in cancer 2 protein [Chelonoidis abingdonii]XP_032620579.1 hypermethylated in cancer 2 protein [Chelonoidis abingdonii]XP_032620580.1 hypermethylated in cancer 2 protein [Chelonoidis abingdonii]XP_032620581.1 hypermethylated in cancer 2 protein [Chelonoidis abingdonii]XP_032620583.1 hypermethylated in cancer 2 protein [Chelono